MGPLVLVSVVFPVNVIANPIMDACIGAWEQKTFGSYVLCQRTISIKRTTVKYETNLQQYWNVKYLVLPRVYMYRGAKLKWNDIYFSLCHIDLYPMYFIRIISNWPKTLEISTKSTQYYLVEHIESRCILHYCNI